MDVVLDLAVRVVVRVRGLEWNGERTAAELRALPRWAGDGSGLRTEVAEALPRDGVGTPFGAVVLAI